MEWPSKNVSQGGILHPPKPAYSPETHKFLKVLMDESKLSMLQRKKIDYYLRNGEALPPPSTPNVKKNRKTPAVLIRPGSSKRRSRETILRSGAYEREKFVPKPKPDREIEKNRLINRMAFGKDVEPKIKSKRKVTEAVPEINRFDQLVMEIKEREDFLKQMDELGEGAKHRFAIQQQIHARIREMEKLKIADD